ncbi:MAG TPA: cytochrome c maturation protein CcmE, partial [Mycobacteriales bacterium]|nr:cytochrome c maturation protein CcmE [Mycobacteriales bacterium]
MTATLKLAAVVVVVAACVGYLIYSASGGSAEYYLTVSELRAQQPATGDVRVAGVVQNDVVRSDGGLHVRFTEKDSTASVLVDYSGPVPDIFQPGITVVADGR